MKFLVIGDSCTDIFYFGNCDKMCPEAPVPVFTPVDEPIMNGGMALNVYVNVIAMGHSCDIITNDETITKTRYIDKKTNQMLMRIDDTDWCKRVSIEIIEGIDSTKYDGIIISDYNKGFLTEEDMELICRTNENVFIDTKKILGNWCKHATLIKINELEYNKTMHTIDNDLKKILITTTGEKGCMYNDRTFPVLKNMKVKDIAGAGDTFHAALSTRYTETYDIELSIDFAQECAMRVVQKRGVNTI